MLERRAKFGALRQVLPEVSERRNVVTDFPETVEAAVRLLQELVPDGERAAIPATAVMAAIGGGDLIKLHHGRVQWVRNHLGLWSSNPTLLAATGEQSADDASNEIVRAFWVTLREKLLKLY